MNKIMVMDASSLADVAPRTIIGIGEKVFEVVPMTNRWGDVVVIADDKGHAYEIKVCEFGKMRTR